MTAQDAEGSGARTGFLPAGMGDALRRRLVSLGGLTLITVAGAFVVALAGYDPADPSLNAVGASGAAIANPLGLPGAVAADLMLQSLGLANAVPALLLGAWGWRLVSGRGVPRPALRLAFLPMVILGACFALAVVTPPASWPMRAGFGGFVGSLLASEGARLVTLLPVGLQSWFTLGLGGAAAAVGALSAMIGLWCIGASRTEWFSLARRTVTGLWSGTRLGFKGGLAGGRALGGGLGAARQAAAKGLDGARRRIEPSLGWGGADDDTDEPQGGGARDGKPAVERREPKGNDRETETTGFSPVPTAPVAPVFDTPRAKSQKKEAARGKQNTNRQATLALGSDEGGFVLPSLDLLEAPARQGETSGPDDEALWANARALEGVLQDFGVKGEIVKVRHGPVVTLYELEPAPGTKSSRVIGLADDIARSMSAISVRVAVVPGRNAIGIELPNATRQMVYFREILETDAASDTKAKLPIGLGKDIGGDPVIVDLARMPHLLIAGTTGSGKSVAVNTMILSLLYQHTPERCRMIMIDPKMLELSIYEGIPHLLSPVVTDPKKAVVALKWTVREMETRYRAMSKLGVRNIDGYNARLAEAREKGEVLKRRVQTGFDPETGKPVFEDEPLDLTPLPFIVVIIDEVADLMLVAGKDIEGAVQRLAQMARAAGIHVIMATQRPSVDVITGTIKANFPTRISFQVTSKIDSRTILGEQGAEQLLGQGDMLHMAGGGRITRVHGPFVSDEEVEDVVRHLRTQGEPDYNESVTDEADDATDILGLFDNNGDGDGADGGSGDTLYDQAVALVAREKKASTSFIQRHLKIGYNRAATLIERMEQDGVVSSANHVGKREVLVGDHSE